MPSNPDACTLVYVVRILSNIMIFHFDYHAHGGKVQTFDNLVNLQVNEGTWPCERGIFGKAC